MAKKSVIKKIKEAQSIEELIEIGKDEKDKDSEFVRAMYGKMEELLAEKK
jgi:hypothetical protein